MKKSLTFLLLCTLLFACEKKASNPEKVQILRLNTHGEPPTMDLRKAIDSSSISLLGLCFEGLMRHVKNSPPEFAMAERVDVSEDRLRYTFYLRESYWWDGKPVTAQDFELTWKSILDPLFPAPTSNDLYVIKGAQEAKSGKIPLTEVGITSIDSKTLLVELKNPIPYFLDLVSSHAFWPAPQHIVSKYPHWADRYSEHFVGNGPYRLVKWRHHNHMLFEKNPFYWGKDQVNLEKIDILMIADETTELNMFEAGDLDWAGRPFSTLPTDALFALSKQKRLNTYPISGTYFYVFNVKEPPFDNVNFRKALALAINRQDIIDNVTQARQLPAMALIPPTMWTLNTQFFDDYNLLKAREYFARALKEMNLTLEQLPPITLSYNTLEAHHKIAQAIQHQWQYAFGIRVKLQNKEWKVFLDELSHKQFQIARMGGVADFNDPISFLDQYRYSAAGTNYSGWVNLEYNALIEEAERTIDPDARHQLLKKAETILMDEMPIIPLYFYTGSYVRKPYVHNVQISDLSEVNFRFAYIEW